METGIIHFNVYTTDKSLTYHPTDGKHFAKFITHKHALSAPKDEYLQEIDKLYKTLRRACTANPPVEGHVRVELRVKVERAKSILVSLPDRVWKSMIMAHSCLDWW
jgi:hypothetical protein